LAEKMTDEEAWNITQEWYTTHVDPDYERETFAQRGWKTDEEQKIMHALAELIVASNSKDDV